MKTVKVLYHLESQQKFIFNNQEIYDPNTGQIAILPNAHESIDPYEYIPQNKERESGFPMPDRYNSYYVNQYSLPKSFV